MCGSSWRSVPDGSPYKLLMVMCGNCTMHMRSIWICSGHCLESLAVLRAYCRAEKIQDTKVQHTFPVRGIDT